MLISTETVGAGHPDVLCDMVAEALCQHIVDGNPAHRAAMEVAFFGNTLIVGGECRHSGLAFKVSDYTIAAALDRALCHARYPQGYFDDLKIQNFVHAQSADIAANVDKDTVTAGDQGVMYGHYYTGTPTGEYLHQYIAESLSEIVSKFTHTADVFADYKLLVTLDRAAVQAVAVSAWIPDTAKELRIVKALNQAFNTWYKQSGIKCTDNYALHLNPAGPFTHGGPQADAGVTGRKLLVNYGGAGTRIGGGAYFGKDFSKCDRLGPELATQLAKDIAFSHKGQGNVNVEVLISYVMGDSVPRCFNVTICTDRATRVLDIPVSCVDGALYDDFVTYLTQQLSWSSYSFPSVFHRAVPLADLPMSYHNTLSAVLAQL